MIVQRINNALSVILAGIENVASLALGLIRGRCKSLSDCKTKVTLAIANFSSVLAVLKLNVSAEVRNLTLSLAAAVLKSLDNIAVTEVNCVDNALSREANLASNLLDSSLNITAALLESVEVDVEGLCKLAKSKAITLDSRLNAVGILVVLQLSANSIELSLSFDTLCSNARAVPVPEAEASIAE